MTINANCQIALPDLPGIMGSADRPAHRRINRVGRNRNGFRRMRAAYWLSRTTTADPEVNRWAIAGLRVMVGGQPQDEGVLRMLERLRG